MVWGLNSSTDGELEWMGEFSKGEFSLIIHMELGQIRSVDFRWRFLSLLSFKF
jgi:N-acetyltransferase 10